MVVRKKNLNGDKPAKKEEELFSDLDRDSRRWRFCSFGGCFGLLFLLGILVIVAIVSALTLAGLASPPIFKTILYPNPPQPSRTVEASPISKLDELLQEKISAGYSDGSKSLRLTEEEITGLLKEPNESGEVFLKEAQLAIDDKAQLYGQIIPDQPDRQPIVIRAIVEANSSGDQVFISSVKVGYLPVPVRLASWLVKFLTGLDPTSSAQLEKYGIVGVELEQGAVSIKFGSDYYTRTLKQTDLGELLGDPNLEGLTIEGLEGADLSSSQTKSLEQATQSANEDLAKLIQEALDLRSQAGN